MRVLVDRVWPRGLTKERAAVVLWLKEIAPSTELRTWFGHDPDRWDEFRKRYHAELAENEESVGRLVDLIAASRVTLLFGARDEKRNQAVALAEYLNQRLESAKT